MIGTELKYESDINLERSVQFVDRVGYNSERKDYSWWMKRAVGDDTVDALDLAIIVSALEEHLNHTGVSSIKRTLTKYMVPTQDTKELAARQAVVRDLVSSKHNMNCVEKLISTASSIDDWTDGYFQDDNLDITEYVRQLFELHDFVSEASKLEVKSKRLLSIKKFAKHISETSEYYKIQSFRDFSDSQLFSNVCEHGKGIFGIFEKALTCLGEVWNKHGGLSNAKLVEMYARILESKRYDKIVDILDVRSRRAIFHALREFQGVFRSIMHEPQLEGLIDRDEAQRFKLENRIETAISAISDTSIIDYGEYEKVKSARKHFRTQFARTIYHTNLLVREGISKIMRSVTANFGTLDQELSFYYSLASLSLEFKQHSPIVMPKIRPKDECIAKVINARVPSMLLRLHRSKYLHYDSVVFNNIDSIEGERACVITGPNDNGKTTYERLVGQVQILFQLGSYIPAKSAHLSVVDGIYTSFSSKDKPEDREGLFKSGIKFLEFITNPRAYDENDHIVRLNNFEKISHAYANRKLISFSPYSLVLLDEIGIGSDTDATEEAIRLILSAAAKRGTRMYISTHYHPIPKQVLQGKFPGVINLGAMMEEDKEGNFIPTYKIVRGRHEPSRGLRLFDCVGYTQEMLRSSSEMFENANFSYQNSYKVVDEDDW